MGGYPGMLNIEKQSRVAGAVIGGSHGSYTRLYRGILRWGLGLIRVYPVVICLGRLGDAYPCRCATGICRPGARYLSGTPVAPIDSGGTVP
jgi:hypothetical protein